jgi:hypothetical protein
MIKRNDEKTGTHTALYQYFAWFYRDHCFGFQSCCFTQAAAENARF